MTEFWTVVGLTLLIGAAVTVYWFWLAYRYTLRDAPGTLYWATTKDLWQIPLARRPPPSGKGEPVLLCHGLFATHWNLTTPLGSSLADYLAQAGYDCWAIELRGKRSTRPPFGWKKEAASVDDYLYQDLPAAIELILKETGYRRVHWVGHSMGGMLLYAYEAAFGGSQLASGITLGSPPGFAGSRVKPPTALLLSLRVSRRLLSYTVRAVAPILYPIRTRLRFLPVNWNNVIPGMGLREFFNLFDPDSYRVGQELASWAVSGAWRMAGGALDVDAGLKRFETPLLAIYGPHDPLTPRGTREGFFEALPNDDKKMIVLSKKNGYSADYDHVDLVFGKNGDTEVFEPIVDWLKTHPVGARHGSDGKDSGVVFKKKARPKHADPTSEIIVKGKKKARASVAPHRRKRL